jgi:polar amino acid transport system substrate-binding protein
MQVGNMEQYLKGGGIMSGKKKVLAVLACAVMVLSTMLIGCSSPAPAPAPSASASGSATPAVKLVKDGVLTVGSDCDYPPFIELDGDKAVGFEYDMLEALAAELKLKVEYLPPQNFDSILASVATGAKMDLGVSSFTITDERKELIDFCTPYVDSNQAVVALKAKGYKSALDLNGKTVGAQSGTTGADWVNEHLKDPATELKTYNQTSDALAALMAGQIEAVFFDEPVAAEQVSTTYTDAEIVESIATGEQYGIAVSKDNPALKDDVNKALQTIKANGTFDRIFNQWFPNLQAPSLKPAA